MVGDRRGSRRSHRPDSFVVVAELGPDQRRDQPDKFSAVDQLAQRERIGRESEPARRFDHARIRVGIDLVPDPLDLAQEDVGPDWSDPLELLQELALTLELIIGRFTKLANITAVLVEDLLCSLTEHRRGALVVALVPVPGNDIDPRLPTRLGHLPGRRQPGVEQRLGGPRRVRGRDPSAEQQREDHQLKHCRRGPALDSNPRFVGIGLAVLVEQNPDDRLFGRCSHTREASKAYAIA